MNDDHLIANMVSECLRVMRDYDTVSKLTACYNLTGRILRLFCIQGEKKDVLALIDKFHEGMKKEIKEYYKNDR